MLTGIFNTKFIRLILTKSMIFERESGKPYIQPYKKTASTAFAAGDPVTTSSGLLVKAGAAVTPATLVGVINRDVTSADTDYADASFVEVEVPKEGDVFVAEVGTGTATAAMVGGRYDLDANGQVNVTASTNDVVEIVRFIDASTVVVKFVNS